MQARSNSSSSTGFDTAAYDAERLKLDEQVIVVCLYKCSRTLERWVALAAGDKGYRLLAACNQQQLPTGSLNKLCALQSS
jgi:hypothetical protein